MNKDIAISVENLSKAYKVRRARQERYVALRDVLANGARDFIQGKFRDSSSVNSREPFWALRDVSFEVKRGEVVGIIGRNGAGKSTLLKILSRVAEPTSGRVILRGRAAALLEVGTGFHPELTGRENIFLSGAILGMSRWEIRKKFDEIVAFSGVEEFIDTPVKRYSSGMYVRLGFAVAAHLEPEILLVDEVLAVGDAEFQKKCLGKIKDVASQGRTVLFVSHNMGAILRLCKLAMLLTDGKISVFGRSLNIVRYYQDVVKSSTHKDMELRFRKGTGVIKLKSVNVFSDIENENFPVYSGGPLYIKLVYWGVEKYPLKEIRIDLRIDSILGERIGWMSTELKPKLSESKSPIIFRNSKCQLKKGLYSITVCSYVNGEEADWINDAFTFEILEGDYYKNGKQVPEGQGAFLLDFDIL